MHCLGFWILWQPCRLLQFKVQSLSSNMMFSDHFPCAFVNAGTPNQDNPLMKGVCDEIKFPILGLDVWEHAYYLRYQNKRGDYLSAIWSLLDWGVVSEKYAAALNAPILAKIEKENWPEMNAFHKVLAQTFHAAEKGDFKSIFEQYRNSSEEEVWNVLKAYVSFDNLVHYAKPFDLLFPHGEADRYLDYFSDVIRILKENSENPDVLLSTTLRRRRGRILLRINFGNWAITALSANSTGREIQVVLPINHPLAP